jgi:hypothetical protein
MPRFRPRLEILEGRLCPSSATLDYSTFLGGKGTDVAYDVAVDSAGNSYVTGMTTSKDFPATAGAFQTHFTGNADAFVAKFSPTGALIYATYLGASSNTIGHGIAVDQSGDAYVTGATDSNKFPVKNAYQSHYGGGSSDAFVTKLNPTGSALLYSTYLGGTEGENLNGSVPYGSIAVDQSGNAYVTGTGGGNFPTLNGLPLNTDGGGFVTRLNTNAVGSASLVYSTLLPAATATGIAVDNAGDAFVTGTDGAGNFPTTPGAYLTSGGPGYVAKLDTNAVGSPALVYATYLNIGLFPHAIAVDQSGNAYVAGLNTVPMTLPATPNAFQPSSLQEDAFVLGLNASGTGITYASYLGGTGQDGANGIAVDSAGHIYITGQTGSADFPTQNAFQSMPSTGGNAFVAEFDPTATTAAASLIYSSYLGDALGYGIAVDSAGDVVVVGQAHPGLATVNAFQATYHGAFVTKVAPPA